jgi:Ran GTPase-activating protein (RanGAP) involved in mRNA processing and transport
MSDPNDSTSTGDDVSFSLSFLEFCAKVRNNDPSVLPDSGGPLRIRHLSEKEGVELADALLENTNVTYLELNTGEYYTKSSVEAMVKYLRTSEHLQRIRLMTNDRVLKFHEEVLCYFLHAIQESTSLQELRLELPLFGGPSNMALNNMLTYTQSLQTLSLMFPVGLEDTLVAAAASGLKKNTTLRELTLEFSRGTTSASPILTSLRDHPFLRRLSLCGNPVNVTGLETVLLSDTSKITELDIWSQGGLPIMGLTGVLRALARHPKLTKLILDGVQLCRDEARLLRLALCESLQTLVLTGDTLGSAGLAELAPALYRNTSIKVLDLSGNTFHRIESSVILRDIMRHNQTMTALDVSRNRFGGTPGAVECIADGLGSNSTLLKINLTQCALRDGGISMLAQTLGSRNTTLQKITLDSNNITSTGVGVLLETMEHNSHHITDLELRHNLIRNEGASLLARSLGNNALPNLTCLSLSQYGIADDGFIALVSALKQNTSLLKLDLRSFSYPGFSERAFLALAESLPEIKMLERADLTWCTGLASAMPLLVAGLRKNTSLFHIHVSNCAPLLFPPTPEETYKCAGGRMQEMERLGYRNRFLPLIRAPKERLPPRGVWPHALARVARLPNVIFEVLRSKPILVPSEHTKEGTETAKDIEVSKKL